MKTRSQTLVCRTKKDSLRLKKPAHSEKPKLRSGNSARLLKEPTRSEAIESEKLTLPPGKPILRSAVLPQLRNKEEILETNKPATKLIKKSNGKHTIAEYHNDFEVYVVGDIVWAKLKGHPNWPAKVIF